MLPIRVGSQLLRLSPTRRHCNISQSPWMVPRRSFARHHPKSQHTSNSNANAWLLFPTCAIILGTGCYAAYHYSKPFKRTLLAAVRCSRVAGAAIASAIDYKFLMLKDFESEIAESKAYSACHKRSAERVLRALLANGGIFIKLGQHMSSLVVLPVEWTTTMTILQDKCEPTPYKDLERLFLKDMGQPIEKLFDSFDPIPIGVASLAQVHTGFHKESGKRVAVKLQHPHLAEFCDIDMKMIDVTLGWIKYWFSEFEFSWLADEMRSNLPKEMDFIHEANNANRTAREFSKIKTSLYIPEVILATKRVLIMEYIKGARPDNLSCLAANNIDRNKIAIEISRIFSQMVFLNGWFHADPHPGNLLIRPAPSDSKSPYNFEIVLLDHGLYFDIDSELRVNYARLWLSLMESTSPSTIVKRKKYAQLVGNITYDLYPVFEAAITGRVALRGSWDEPEHNGFRRASSLVDMVPQNEEEIKAIRDAVMQQEGILLSVFDVLRRVPRRLLMVLKLNDLTRNLDHALKTTHSNIRVFLVNAQYCTYAVWLDERKKLMDSIKDRGILSRRLLLDYLSCWWSYRKNYIKLSFVEALTDFDALCMMYKAWIWGL